MAGSRSSTSSLRGVPVKLLLHQGLNKPLDFTLTSAKTPQLRPASPWLLCTQGYAFKVTPYGRPVPDIPARLARCTQRDDQVGEAHALACGYPTALRWGYHEVRFPIAVHKVLLTPGRRRRTQVVNAIVEAG